MTEHEKRVHAILCRAEEKARKQLKSFGDATAARDYETRFENYEEVWARAEALRLLWERGCG